MKEIRALKLHLMKTIDGYGLTVEVDIISQCENNIENIFQHK